MWHNFDHKTIEDCITETVEWRKPEDQRKQDEAQDDYDEFLAENPNFVENFFEEALRKRKEAQIGSQELQTPI